MAHFDLPLDELRAYRSSTPAPDDLVAFWERTLAESRAQAEPVVLDRVDTGLTLVDTHDVTFSGFGGHPVKGWFHRPAGAEGRLPVVVRYEGYGAGRGLPHVVDHWPLAGYAELHMDTRGQGSGQTPGDTADPAGAGPATPGYLTRGLLDPHEHYYRRVYTDAVLAVDAVRALPGVDPSRVLVAGGSQGGGIATAVAALRDDLAGALVDVPFLTDFRRALQVTDNAPYAELRKYLSVHRDAVEQAFSTLAYLDGAVLAPLAGAPALYSVALMDRTCPPSTVYASFNAYGGPKEIVEYPFNDHEGGQAFQDRERLRWARRTCPAVPA